MIVWVNVVLNWTVVVDSTDVLSTCAVVIFKVKVSCITSVDGIILWLLICCMKTVLVIGRYVSAFV